MDGRAFFVAPPAPGSPPGSRVSRPDSDRTSRFLQVAFHPATVAVGWAVLTAVAIAGHLRPTLAVWAICILWTGGSLGWWLGTFLRRRAAFSRDRADAADTALADAHESLFTGDAGDALAMIAVDPPAVDPASAVTAVSAAFLRRLGYEPGELIGHSWRSFLYDPASLEHAEGVAASIARGAESGTTIWRHGRTGEPVALYWIPIGLDGRVFKARDVTETAKLRAELDAEHARRADAEAALAAVGREAIAKLARS